MSLGRVHGASGSDHPCLSPTSRAPPSRFLLCPVYCPCASTAPTLQCYSHLLALALLAHRPVMQRAMRPVRAFALALARSPVTSTGCPSSCGTFRLTPASPAVFKTQPRNLVHSSSALVEHTKVSLHVGITKPPTPDTVGASRNNLLRNRVGVPSPVHSACR